jgi:DNA-binding NarL/FixJ family response regulator
MTTTFLNHGEAQPAALSKPQLQERDTQIRGNWKATTMEIRRVAAMLRDPQQSAHRHDQLADQLIRLCDTLLGGAAGAVRDLSAEARNAYESLSPREHQIFAALAEGLTVNDIAKRLNRSPKTVNNHRTHIMRKLALRNTAELTRLAIQIGVTCV